MTADEFLIAWLRGLLRVRADRIGFWFAGHPVSGDLETWNAWESVA